MKRLFSLFLSIIISASVFCVPLYSSADTEKVQLYYTSVADSSSSSTVSFKVDVPEGVSISGGLEMHITYDTEIFTVSDIEAADRSITHNIKTITDENDDTVPSGVFSIIFDSWDGAIESDITLFIFKLSYEEGLTSGLYEFPFNNIYCFDEDLNHIPFEYNGNISLNAAAVEAEFKKFSSMDKGLIDLIPAAVEAVKQESMKKMELFSSNGKADLGRAATPADMDYITKLVAAEIAKYLNK